MSSINEKILAARAKVEQLERQKRLRDNHEKNKLSAIDTRRKIIIGELITKYFPEVLQFQPRRSAKENAAEFKIFEDFLSVFAADKEYIDNIQKQINRQTPQGNRCES